MTTSWKLIALVVVGVLISGCTTKEKESIREYQCVDGSVVSDISLCPKPTTLASAISTTITPTTTIKRRVPLVYKLEITDVIQQGSDVLIVKGTTNLPDGSDISVDFYDDRGPWILSTRAKGGKFERMFGPMSRIPPSRRYEVSVIFSPFNVDQPAYVIDEVGKNGENLNGPNLAESSLFGGNMLEDKVSIGWGIESGFKRISETTIDNRDCVTKSNDKIKSKWTWFNNKISGIKTRNNKTTVEILELAPGELVENLATDLNTIYLDYGCPNEVNEYIFKYAGKEYIYNKTYIDSLFD